MPCHTHLRDNPTNLEWKHKLEITGVLEQRVHEGILQKVNCIKKFYLWCQSDYKYELKTHVGVLLLTPKQLNFSSLQFSSLIKFPSTFR